MANQDEKVELDPAHLRKIQSTEAMRNDRENRSAAIRSTKETQERNRTDQTIRWELKGPFPRTPGEKLVLNSAYVFWALFGSVVFSAARHRHPRLIFEIHNLFGLYMRPFVMLGLVASALSFTYVAMRLRRANLRRDRLLFVQKGTPALEETLKDRIRRDSIAQALSSVVVCIFGVGLLLELVGWEVYLTNLGGPGKTLFWVGGAGVAAWLGLRSILKGIPQ